MNPPGDNARFRFRSEDETEFQEYYPPDQAEMLELRHGHEAQPAESSTALALAFGLKQSGDLAGAAEVLAAFLSRKPDDALVRVYLANLELERAETGAAVENYKSTLSYQELRPDVRTMAHLGLAEVLTDAEAYEEAITHLLAASEVAPTPAFELFVAERLEFCRRNLNRL